MQKPAAAGSETPHAQQAVSQAEPGPVKDAVNAEQAVKAQEDAERDPDDVRASETSQQADERPTPRAAARRRQTPTKPRMRQSSHRRNNTLKRQ